MAKTKLFVPNAVSYEFNFCTTHLLSFKIRDKTFHCWKKQLKQNFQKKINQKILIDILQ